MYAIFEACGKQYKASEGDTLFLEKLEQAAGEEVVFDKVLYIGDDASSAIGAPYVEGAKVTLAIDGVKRGPKVINFKAKRRKGSRRKVGHRQDLTVATVKAIA